MTNFPIINEIDILKDSQGGDFGCCPGKEARWLLRIVPDHHELVVELREDGFYPFAKSFVSPCRWFPIILIQSIWNFKFDISRVKKILLNLRTQITFVSEHHAVMILKLHIFEIVKIMDIRRSHVIGMDDSAYSAYCVEFISVVMHVLGSAVSPCRSLFPIVPSHGTSLASGILTDFHRLGVNAEHVLASVHRSDDITANLLSQMHCELAALVILASGNKVGKFVALFVLKAFEQAVFTVNSESFGCGREGYDFQIGKLGNNTPAGDVSKSSDTISGKFFEYVKDFSELYDEVVHKRDNGNQWFGHH